MEKCRICGSAACLPVAPTGFVCIPCHRRLPYCPACHLAVSKWEARGESVLCGKCRNPVFRCCVCRSFSAAQFMRLEDRFVCTRCYPETEPCMWCCRWMWRGDCEIVEGYRSCRDCQRQAVLLDDDLAPLHRQASAIVAERLGIRVNTPYKLRPVHAWEKLTTEWRLPNYCTGDFLGLWDNPNLWVSLGMPRWKTLLTLCHEITHAWQSENTRWGNPALVEGLALWVEMKVYDEIARDHEGDRYYTYKFKHRDVYSTGARRLLLMEDQLGPQGVLQYAKEHTEFPLAVTLEERLETLAAGFAA